MENRKNTRAKGYNYNDNGGYFVTICTHEKRHLFGKIVNGEMKLNLYGKFVKNRIEKIDEIYDGVKVDKYAIMPNHLHILIMLGRQRIVCVPQHDRSKEMLPKIIKALKSTITKDIKKYKKWNAYDAFPTIWQKSYYDHVIHDENDYLKVWKYTDENPLKWELDKYYTL